MIPLPLRVIYFDRSIIRHPVDNKIRLNRGFRQIVCYKAAYCSALEKSWELTFKRGCSGNEIIINVGLIDTSQRWTSLKTFRIKNIFLFFFFFSQLHNFTSSDCLCSWNPNIVFTASYVLQGQNLLHLGTNLVVFT